MFSFITSILSGGLTGILGAGVQRIADYFNKKQDIKIMELKFAQDEKMRRIDIEMLDKEWAARNSIAVTEGNAKIDVAESAAFAESMKMEPQRYSKATDSIWLVILDFIRGIVRPGLTIYLAVLTTMMYFELQTLKSFSDMLVSTDVFSVYEMIINTILYLFTTVVLWYFGVRNKGKQSN